MRGSNRLVTQYHVIDFVKSSKAIKSMLHVSLIVLIGSDDKVRIVKKLGLVLRTACRHNHQLFLTPGRDLLQLERIATCSRLGIGERGAERVV